jgi:hypothetical protein
MKRLFLIALLLSGCSSPWTKADTLRQGAYLGLLAADWHQTRVIATARWMGTTTPRWKEYNPILGEHPDRDKVDRYFAACAVGHTAIAAVLPKKWRAVWQYVGIGVQGIVVVHNFDNGIW